MAAGSRKSSLFYPALEDDTGKGMIIPEIFGADPDQKR